jgi:hypothetical protein
MPIEHVRIMTGTILNPFNFPSQLLSLHLGVDLSITYISVLTRRRTLHFDSTCQVGVCHSTLSFRALRRPNQRFLIRFAWNTQFTEIIKCHVETLSITVLVIKRHPQKDADKMGYLL